MPHSSCDATCSTEKSWQMEEVSCNKVYSCLSVLQQDPVCCFTSRRAREAKFRSMHIVISSVISFTMHSAQASEFCLTD
nr:uncharacterized protein LOC102091222 isoform X4 [Columba livia]